MALGNLESHKHEKNHIGDAIRYAKHVRDGKVTACKWTRLACERFLNDCRRIKHDGDFDYVFFRGGIIEACETIETFSHVKGEWAGSELLLEPWQVFIVCNIFGWVHKKTDMRRFRKASLFVGRKNGKSLLAAAIGLFMFAAEDEPGAEVYSGATTEKQAWEVFGPARMMAKRDEEFCAKFGIEVNASNLAIIFDGAKFEPIIGNPGDGASPHCAIADEYHEHPDPGSMIRCSPGWAPGSNP